MQEAEGQAYQIGATVLLSVLSLLVLLATCVRPLRSSLSCVVGFCMAISVLILVVGTTLDGILPGRGSRLVELRGSVVQMPGDLFVRLPSVDALSILVLLLGINVARTAISNRTYSVLGTGLAVGAFLVLVLLRLSLGPSDWLQGPRGTGWGDDTDNYTAVLLRDGTGLQAAYAENTSLPSPLTEEALDRLADLAQGLAQGTVTTREYEDAAGALAEAVDARAVALASSDEFLASRGVVRGGLWREWYVVLVAVLLVASLLSVAQIEYAAQRQTWRDFVQRKRLQLEAIRAEELLTLAMPRQIAHRLMEGGDLTKKFNSVSIGFIYVAGYKEMTYQYRNDLITFVDALHALYCQLDALVLSHDGVYKIESVQNCYLVAAGVPTVNEDHAAQLLQFLLAAQELVRETRIISKQEEEMALVMDGDFEGDGEDGGNPVKQQEVGIHGQKEDNVSNTIGRGPAGPNSADGR